MKTAGVVALVFTLATHPAAAGQDPLAAARDQYAAAAYEEALSTLAKLADGASPDVARQVHKYRAFSLFALGRTAEAEEVAEAWIRMNPLAKLGQGEASPRLEAMFAAVRKRVLPILIRDGYRSARTAIDKADPKAAEPHLASVSQLLAEVRASGAMDEGLSDLSLVVDGFLELARVAAPAPGRETSAAATPSAAVTPPAVSGPPAAASAVGAGTPTARAPIIHSGPGDSHLSPPVVVSQVIPELPRAIGELMKGTTRKSLVIELLIDERGDVQNAAVLESAQPLYDQLVLRAARQWKFRPATMDGVPVKFRRAVSVDFTPR